MFDQAAFLERTTPAAPKARSATRATAKAASIAARIEAIRRRHQMLDRSVEDEHLRPMPDTAVLRSLKRERLRLKDEMQSYEGLLRVLARDPAAP